MEFDLKRIKDFPECISKCKDVPTQERKIEPEELMILVDEAYDK